MVEWVGDMDEHDNTEDEFTTVQFSNLYFMRLRYNLWQTINLHSLGGCVRIKGWVCTYQFPFLIEEEVGISMNLK